MNVQDLLSNDPQSDDKIAMMIRSTDFEVHRNWLAITHSLPVSEWYYESRSEWTLDYPPFFAWFEWFLSQFAPLWDKNMLNVDNINYASDETIYFQRTTVIITELVLLYALKKFMMHSENKNISYILVASIFLNPGLLMGKDLLCGIVFAVLLNFKHIFLYLAPAYFVYLLRHYCFKEPGSQDFGNFLYSKFIILGLSVISIFSLSFGPFLYMGQLGQVFSRLFPFKRGLCHAYWAPNFWALYSFMDRILIIVFRQLGWVLNDTATSSVTRGLVGDVSFAVLPQIPAKTTFIITVVFQMASLAKLWRYPNFKNFIGSTILCGYSSFLFGWHVHEKAVLLIMIPFGLIATESLEHFRTFVILSISGLFSLFPLLFKSTEAIIKISICVLWMVLTCLGLSQTLSTKSESKTTPKPVKSTFVYLLENVYIVGFVILQFFTGVVHQIAFSDGKFQFLPLLATSVYCAIGIVYSWVRFTIIYFLEG
ncbi:Glycosyltransferase Family 57 protein [Gigaspora rosea]|uniref:Alpha-1,3-glucosyltransferase n=1 Tax=Gigaspora rosea TaxID=44941 RepID=A0A397W7F4_9GLOM|nr:Glycosyltransferase Family 57 protein [Gigaspora rosea]